MTRGLIEIESKMICFYCFKTMIRRGHPDFEKRKADQFTIDHRIPVSKGGPNRKSNMVACCQRCNILKGDTTEEEFRKLYARRLESGRQLYEKKEKKWRKKK